MTTRAKTTRTRRPAATKSEAVEPETTSETVETPEQNDEPTEIRFPIDGHQAGDQGYYAIQRRGDKWAVLDNRGGHPFGPDLFDGRMWAPRTEKYEHLAYRFSREEAEEFAKEYARIASEVHQRYAAMVRPEFAAWLAGETETYVAAVREAVAS